MSERQIKEYYERIEKLLNGANKETYGFAPQEIKNILRSYEELQNQNKELKKQLEENQNPLKGIFAQVNDDTLLRDCGNMNAEINELKNQQKEFIEYMNKTIEELECDNVDDEEMKGYLIQRIEIFKEIFSKYKEKIGQNNG